jgi:hypothetical protein
LVREVEGWVGDLSTDQISRRDFYLEMVDTLRRETRALAERIGGSGGIEGLENQEKGLE